MGRMTRLAIAALFSLAAIEVVIAKSQQHFTDSSLAEFQDTCNQIVASISNDSAVYYSRESFFTPPLLGITN